ALKNMEAFSFVGTGMKGHAFAKFDGWTRLTKCSFRGSSIDDEGLKELCAHFPNLESISLAHAKFTDAGAPHLAKLTKLKGLELGNLPMTEDRIAQMRAFAFLKSLRLVQRPQAYPADIQARIRELLPKVQLTFQ